MHRKSAAYGHRTCHYNQANQCVLVVARALHRHRVGQVLSEGVCGLGGEHRVRQHLSKPL